jgi:hypothetical protein
VAILPPEKEDDCTQVRVRVKYKDLIMHPTAQRALRPHWVRDLKKKFRLSVPVVAAVRYPRNGITQTLVVDGQHCSTAAKELGFGEEFVTMIIHTDVQSDKEAHDRFLDLNKRKGVSAIDTYRNEVGAEHPNIVEIEEVLANHGLHVGQGMTDGILRCPAVLVSVHRRIGQSDMNMLFHIIGGAWGYVTASLEGLIVEGLGQVILSCPGLNPKRMAERLKRVAPPTIIGAAKAQAMVKCRLAVAVAQVIIQQYNVGLKNDDNRLVFRVVSRGQEGAQRKREATGKAVM